MSWATAAETLDQFIATTSTYAPADPGDFRFDIIDIGAETEDPFMQVLVLSIDDTGEAFARDIYSSRSEAFDMIEAAREAQAFSLEERLDMYADRGW